VTRPAHCLLLAIAATLCAAAPASAIVGGQVTQRNWPHMAAMEYSDDGGGNWSFRCGGSLIAPDVVLTAAHCVDNEDDDGTYPASNFRFLLGTKVRSGGGERIAAVEVREHPGYNASSREGSDVALFKLQRASTLGRTIRLGQPGDFGRWEPGDPSVIIGWGAEFSGGPATNELKEASVPIVSDATCETSYAFTLGFDPGTSVCAGEATGGEDSCQGDSGGPLMVQDAGGAWVQVGATSFGLGCAFPTQYGVYAETGGNNLRPWIEQNATQMSSAGGLNANPPTPGSPGGGGGGAAPAPAGGGPAPAAAPSLAAPARARVTFATRLGSARRARRTRRLRVLIRSTQRLRGVVVTLRRGRRTVASGRATSLSGSRRITLRVRRGLRAGRATLRVQAVDGAGRRVTVSRRVRLTR
jgi:hypothetical protein